jgi:hypothetical protein
MHQIRQCPKAYWKFCEFALPFADFCQNKFARIPLLHFHLTQVHFNKIGSVSEKFKKAAAKP